MNKVTLGSTKTQGSSKPLKFQISNSKLQTSSKRQASKRGTAKLSSEALATRIREEPASNNGSKRPFDLEERTADFGEAIVRFSKKIPRNPTNDRLIGQLVGCGTSVGANYCEASERVSKKDFRNVIGRCAKEAKESRFFLRMIAVSEPQLAREGRELYREARELHLIFASIYRG